MSDEIIKKIKIGSFQVHGVSTDKKSRCIHWHSEVDIVALRVPGDEIFYPCYACYEAIHQDLPPRWSREDFAFEAAILCGNCANAMSINTYLDSGNQCPHCKHPFNPGCAKHYQYYFE